MANWKKLRENKSNILTLTSEENISPYIPDMWEIFRISYEDIGGLKSYKSPKDMLNKVDVIKVVLKNNKVIACSTYREFLKGIALGSRKMTAIGCDQTKEGKDALKAIIESDIKENDLHYWAETSGSIERIFKVYEGYPIPHALIPELLGKPEEAIINRSEDGAHYERLIAADTIPTRKIVFGMPSNKIFEEAKKKVEETLNKTYDEFRANINSRVREKVDEDSRLERTAYLTEYLTGECEDGNINELLPEWYAYLKESLEMFKDNPKYKKLVRHMKSLLDLPILELHKFEF